MNKIKIRVKVRMNKRLSKEIRELYQQQAQKEKLLDNDYIVHLDDTNTSNVFVILKCPEDSVYHHKFIIFRFDIPQDYPHSPPVVTFINNDASRIHPNMYEDGKCCCTILNTWPSLNEKWTSSMGIETVILAFCSFLDNTPYTHEPGGHDDESYTDFVKFQTWETCLIEYLEDPFTPESFREFILEYLNTSRGRIEEELSYLNFQYPAGYYYTRCFEIDNYYIDYYSVRDKLYRYLDSEIEYDMFFNLEVEQNTSLSSASDITTVVGDQQNSGYGCSICFDTLDDPDSILIKTKCDHGFHQSCIVFHIKTNGDVCPICRGNEPLIVRVPKRKRQNYEDDGEEEYIKNPLTNRMILVGGRTWIHLSHLGLI
jgi:ubiquitin-protein ligase